MNTTQKYTVVASSLALIAVMFNVSIVGPALPALQAGLNSSANALAWVVNAYNIVFASLLLAGGLLGDRFGHRWILHVGLLITLLGALLAATAPTVGWLLGARAVQGVGSSLLQPASLALLTYAFPEPKARTRAIGLWGGMSGLGIALGPVLGGLLVDLVSWRAIFVPMMLVGVGAWLVSLRWVVETPTQTNKPLDGWGLLLAVVTLFALSYGLSQGALLGWTSPLILTVFALALVSFALFIVVEKRHSTPLVALAFFALPTYTVANLAGLLASFGSFGLLVYLGLYMQQGLGFSATQAGVITLLFPLGFAFFSPMSGQLAARFGPRLPASAGLLLAGMTGLGFLQLGLATEPMMLWLLFFAWGSGLGLATGALTNAAVSELPQTRAGMGASVLAAMRQIGTALGVALLGALITIVLAGSLPAALQSLPIAPEQQSELAAQIVREGLGTAIMVAGIPTTELQQLVRVTYLNGLRVAAVVAAAGLLTASLLAAYFMVGVIRRPAEASAGQAPVGVTPKS